MKETLAKKGFVTIATGDTRYYKLAVNLLRSYRLHTGNPYCFAILCDRNNEYTALFDDVIILDNPTSSYIDKLRLFEYMPYEETIFIDADSLAYGDLNQWFQFFSENDNSRDFSCFGFAIRDLSSNKGWFRVSGMRGILRFYCIYSLF